MKLSLSIFLLFCLTTTRAQQNLVPNYSFEDKVYCPAHQNDYASQVNWFRVGITSVDLFNACSSNEFNAVPQNFLGSQAPQHGDAYVGVVLYLNNPQIEYREYVAVKLTESLQAGKKYCVRFYAAQADSAWLQTNTIAAYIGDSLSTQTSHALPYIPQITTTAYIENNTGWQLIEGEYTAQGGERYITIGSFVNDANTTWGPNSATPSTAPNTSQMFRQSYVYIDNVELKECQKVGIDEDVASEIVLFPNPTNDVIMVQTPATANGANIKLYNVTGSLVYQSELKAGTKNKLDLGVLTNGMYIAQVLFNSTLITTQKIVITR